jgi:hypothetical protein
MASFRRKKKLQRDNQGCPWVWVWEPNLIMQKFRQLLLHPSKKYSFGLRKTEQFVEI